MEQQIKEVLEHIKTQVPPPPLSPQPTVSSAVVQTSTHSPDAVWKKRAAELERQLKEEREQLRQLEERNRTWQEAITSQHKVRRNFCNSFVIMTHGNTKIFAVFHCEKAGEIVCR